MGPPRHASYLGTTQKKTGHTGLHSSGEQQGQQSLLPGLPDELTLDLIATKLPWTSLIVLPSVSRVWHCAIQSRQVYEARKRAKATEPLLVENYFRSNERSYGFRVGSSRDNGGYLVWRVLPGIDTFLLTIHLASIDGKVYALAFHDDCCGRGSRRVFMRDVAAHKPWTECASMRHARGCIMPKGFNYVKDGKIYVTAGSQYTTGEDLATEVYDPELDDWSLINPEMHSDREPPFLKI